MAPRKSKLTIEETIIPEGLYGTPEEIVIEDGMTEIPETLPEDVYIPFYESMPLKLDEEGIRRQEELMEMAQTKENTIEVLDGDKLSYEKEPDSVVAMSEMNPEMPAIFQAFLKDGVLSAEKLRELFSGIDQSVVGVGSRIKEIGEGWGKKKKKWRDHKKEKKEKKLRKIAKASRQKNRKS